MFVIGGWWWGSPLSFFKHFMPDDPPAPWRSVANRG